MVVLRPTRILDKLLPYSAPLEAGSTTALGDWYVKPVVVGRRRFLLLVSSASLLPMVLAGSEARSLPARLAGLVGDRLLRAGFDHDLIEAEKRAMSPVVITGTLDRSVIGIIVDFGHSLPYYLRGAGDAFALHEAEDGLAETPCFAGRRVDKVVVPIDRAETLLLERWGKGSGLPPS